MDKLKLQRILDEAVDELIENKVVHDACMAFLKTRGIQVHQQRGFSYLTSEDSTREYVTLGEAITAALEMTARNSA